MDELAHPAAADSRAGPALPLTAAGEVGSVTRLDPAPAGRRPVDITGQRELLPLEP